MLDLILEMQEPREPNDKRRRMAVTREETKLAKSSSSPFPRLPPFLLRSTIIPLSTFRPIIFSACPSLRSLACSRSSEETQLSTTLPLHDTVEAYSSESDSISVPSSSSCSTPRPSIDHSDHSNDSIKDSLQQQERSEGTRVVVGEKRKRDEGGEEGEEEGGSVDKKSKENESLSSSSKVERKRTKIWSGDLEDKVSLFLSSVSQSLLKRRSRSSPHLPPSLLSHSSPPPQMTLFKILATADNPIQEFEQSQKGFMEGWLLLFLFLPSRFSLDSTTRMYSPSLLFSLPLLRDHDWFTPLTIILSIIFSL